MISRSLSCFVFNRMGYSQFCGAAVSASCRLLVPFTTLKVKVRTVGYSYLHPNGTYISVQIDTMVGVTRLWDAPETLNVCVYPGRACVIGGCRGSRFEAVQDGPPHAPGLLQRHPEAAICDTCPEGEAHRSWRGEPKQSSMYFSLSSVNNPRLCAKVFLPP